MRLTNFRYLVVLALLLSSIKANAQQWNPSHSIGTPTGNYAFAYNQVPGQLVEVLPAAIPNTGLTYQWEQSAEPVTGFFAIQGAQQSSYTVSTPLSQTTYYRRITYRSGGGGYIYSNTLKLQLVSASWEDKNYIREHDVTITGVTTWQAVDQLPIGQKFQTTTYMDGLGRSVEKVSRETATPAQSNGLWGDMVQFSEYDAYGRQEKSYLPYTTTTASGKFKTTPTTEQTAYYSSLYNETNAFSQVSFFNDPLDRAQNLKQPGTSWAAGNGTTVTNSIGTAPEVHGYYLIYNTDGSVTIDTHDWAINVGDAFVKRVLTDENGKKVIEYVNTLGQLILRKVQLDPAAADNSYTGWICTMSIYDDFGHLRYQIQPEGVKYLAANQWSFAGTNGQTILNEQCFYYQYDAQGRNILKRAPGAAPLRMIYDNRDRLVFTQDGNQALKSPVEWTATLYDELDRPKLTTLYRTTKTVAALQTDIDNALAASNATITNPAQPIIGLVLDNRQGGITRYAAQTSIELVSNTTGGFESGANDDFIAEIDAAAATPATIITTSIYQPISPADLNNASVCSVLKYLFYDNYNFADAKPFSTATLNTTAYNTSDPNVVPLNTTARTLSFLTGSSTRVLGTGTFLKATEYYDEDGNHIQHLEDNIKSGSDITTLQYHFDGRLLSSYSSHSTANTGYTNFGTLTKYLFDKIGRVTSLKKAFGTNALKTIASYDYDDIGRLKTKHLDPGYTGSGKNELEGLSYNYNIHGNITGINKDYALKAPGYNKWNNFFGLYLGYDNRDGVFAAAQLDGHVTGLLWNTQGDDAQRKYDYTYDAAGRLTVAAFNQRQTTGDAWSNAKLDFSVSGSGGKIGYDLNGNLLSMLQMGVVPGASAPVPIDNLQYSYASYSNKLSKVTDVGASGTANGGFGDFKDGTNGSTDDYVYDANGNLVIDLNKGAKELAGVTGANGIRYNFLDKPEEIHITGKGTIKIVYSADGEKLQKLFTPEGTSATTTTTYIGAYVYKEDVLQYINFEEGRIRVVQPVAQNNGLDGLAIDGNMDLPGGKRGAYDYMIRDYQQNVRMILTEEVHSGSNIATMETTRATGEEAVFGQSGSNNELAQSRFAVSSIPGQGSGGGWQNSGIGSQVSKLSALTGRKVGPNVLLKVMSGDVLNATTQYWYKDPVSNGTGSTLASDVLGSLVQAIAGSPSASGVTKAGASGISSQLNTTLPFTSLIAPDANNTTGSAPKAYLTAIFFDERFQYVGESSGGQRVAENPGQNASLTLANLKAPKNGYVYIYLSNESNEPVYFDNFQVGHNRGRIIEEDHYYSYGLKITAISSVKSGDANEGLLNNKNLFNDKEFVDEADLDWYDYGFRYYDPQIGRFPQLDPLTDSYPYYTPFQYAGCEPIANIDLDGLEEFNVVKTLETVTVQSLKHTTHVVKTMSFLSRVTTFIGKHVLPRVAGGFKTVVGGAIMAVGFATAEFGIGVPIIMFGADIAASGARQVWDGKEHQTITGKILQENLNMSPEEANELQDLATIYLGGSPLGTESSLARQPIQEMKALPKKFATASKGEIEVITTKGVNELLEAGNVSVKNGYTAAGNALKKHGNRPGSIFPKAQGNPAAINAQGEAVLNEIITNPNTISVTRHHARFGNVLEYRSPGGRGARFSGDGKTFIGFIE